MTGRESKMYQMLRLLQALNSCVFNFLCRWSQGVLDSAQKAHVSLTGLVWLFVSRYIIDAQAEVPILWPPDGKN